jgi:glycosyltransferase domain-containing protein
VGKALGVHDLTVVIMTYNRSRYARRSIAFHERQNQQALVIDGSDYSALSVQEQSELQSVRYFHVREPFHKRLAMAGSLIETPFVILQGDDDFLLKSGLESCCNVLRHCPEASSVCGIPLFQRRLDNGKWHVFPWTSGTPPLDWDNASIFDSRPIDRLKRHFTPYCPTSMYGVMRKSAFAQITSSASRLAIPNIYREEYLFESVLAIVGSIHVLPVVTWLKSNENVSITERETDVGFFEFLARATSDGAISEFVNLVFDTVHRIEPTTQVDREELTDAFNKLVQSDSRQRQASPNYSNWKTNARRRLVSHRYIRALGRTSRDVFRGTYSPNPWVRSGRSMVRRGITSDLIELREISRVLMDFHR